MVLGLFTVRDRKLRKLGVGRTVETARADAAKQVLRYIKEGEKFFLEQSVIYLRRGRVSPPGTLLDLPTSWPARGGALRTPRICGKDALQQGTEEIELAEEGIF